MRTTLLFTFIVTFVVACSLFGCNGMRQKDITVKFTIRNDSRHSLTWVELDWAGPAPPGGILIPGTGKTAYDVIWPNQPGAKLKFLDEQTRKPYSIDIMFAATNEKVRSGNCKHVTIRILDYDKAEVVCE
jgi:hypothetical protein